MGPVRAPSWYVGVVGPGEATEEERALAYDVGRLLAGVPAVVVTGGLGGVMEAASRGAVEAGGVTLGLLPGASRTGANRHLTVSVPTGLGEMRNALVVRTCEVLVAVGGSWGTLSEIALARRAGVPVYGIGTWDLGPEGPVPLDSPVEAVERVSTHLGGR
jgi:uncharacterized protein (TIGR00725 family)